MKTAVSILALAAALAPPAVADETRFQAVWQSGTGTNLFTTPEPRADFLETGERLTAEGRRLIDVETAVVDGRRVYAGLWIDGTGGNIFAGPFGPIDLREAIDAQEANGLRLVDFEIFRENGGRRYLAVFRSGTGRQLVTGPLELDAFFSRGESLTADGFRLIDVEVEDVGGRRVYSGLWRDGTGANLFTAPRRPAGFRAVRNQMREDGLELVDVERFGPPGRQRFVGVFASGAGEGILSIPRNEAAFLELGAAQTEMGLRTGDFEMFVVGPPPSEEEEEEEGGGGDPPPPELPENPRNVSFNDERRLRIQWTQIDDQLFTLDLPRAALPDWLPEADGEPLLPETFCALRLRRADSIFWQVPGDPEVTEPPFRATPDVSDLGPEFFLGGVVFSGPMGGCAGTQTEWAFDFPFTEGDAPFEPLENMSLVVEMIDGEIAFLPDGPPDADPIDPDELFEDDTEDRLEALLETFADLFEEGEDIEPYCETVGFYWTEVCTQSPGACPERVAELPVCLP